MDIEITQDALNKLALHQKYKKRVKEVIQFFNDVAEGGECNFSKIEEFIISQNKMLLETSVPAKLVYAMIPNGNKAPIMDLGIKWDKEYADQMVQYGIELETECQ